MRISHGKHHFLLGLLLVSLSASLAFAPSRAKAQEVSQKEINLLVEEAVLLLKANQGADGSYNYASHRVGATSLVLLALRTAGVAKDDPVCVKACAFISNHISSNTYEEGLVPCALELMDPKKYRNRIKASVAFLEKAQGAKTGGWGYGIRKQALRIVFKNRFHNVSMNRDESCSQYAVLGLSAAERCGVKVSKFVKSEAKRFFYQAQRGNGGWSYKNNQMSTVSMTCAGLSSLTLLGEKLERPTEDCSKYIRNKKLMSGVNFLTGKLPGFFMRQTGHFYYALYGLERTGILMGLKKFGEIDWYREGCSQLANNKNWKKNIVDASFALLFMTKNAAPYAITKLQWRGDWNNDHFDVANWVKHVGEKLERPLDWQTSDLSDGLKSAGRSSMIFINGHKKFKLSKKQLATLRQFLADGGIIVGEACCGKKTFFESFRKVMEEKLFPKMNYRFKLVAAHHPILSCDTKISAFKAGLYMLGRGCGKKSVFLLRKDISCVFNGEKKKAKEIKQAQAVGSNILIFALGKRKPKQKFHVVENKESSWLDKIQSEVKLGSGVAFQYENPLGRVRHNGDWNSDPSFFDTLNTFLAKNDRLAFFDAEVSVDPESKDLHACACVWLTGHGDPNLSPKAIANLQSYINNGGSIIVNACCGDEEFHTGFLRLVKRIFPDREFRELPLTNRIFHLPYDLSNAVVEATTKHHELYKRGWPKVYGVSVNGRWAMLYTPADFCCALEGDVDDEDKPCLKIKSALPFVANLLSAGMKLEDLDHVLKK